MAPINSFSLSIGTIRRVRALATLAMGSSGFSAVYQQCEIPVLFLRHDKEIVRNDEGQPDRVVVRWPKQVARYAKQHVGTHHVRRAINCRNWPRKCELHSPTSIETLASVHLAMS